MPERLSIPGFLVGKRLINRELNRYRYGTIYHGSDLQVFRSLAYLDRLNNPSEWSLKLQPAFRNFLRVACDRIASGGNGDGGAIATIRLNFASGGTETDLRDGAQVLAERLLNLKGVCRVHVGVSRTEVSDIRTRETELRPEMHERVFDSIVLVEGSGFPELEAIASEVEAIIVGSDCAVVEPATLIYNLAYMLTSRDVK